MSDIDKEKALGNILKGVELEQVSEEERLELSRMMANFYRKRKRKSLQKSRGVKMPRKRSAEDIAFHLWDKYTGGNTIVTGDALRKMGEAIDSIADALVRQRVIDILRQRV